MIAHTPLFVDIYQLTMAYGYWRLGMHEQNATFHLLFRKNPFHSNYALSCGLGSIVDLLKNYHFSQDDLNYLATLKNNRQEPLFPAEFLDYLGQMRLTCDIDAVPEGTVVFAHEPVIRVQGPILQCQLLESPLLNIMNFGTLIATKASRVCQAAKGDPVIEFGLRRAHGPNGALLASRAAYIGGCVSTSNTLAGKNFGIPVRGTHAHSWVTAFPSEADAFAAYCEVMPHNCILLVDTYDTIQGVKNAIAAGKKLRDAGGELLAIRLDSGDMADLSIKARQLLDAAGFEKTGILASNSLDEYQIKELKEKGAKISMWGVGTNLVTAFDEPALEGVYKLSAFCNKQGEWEYKLKISEQTLKTSNPGRHQIRRFFCDEQYVMDVIYDLSLGIPDVAEMVCMDNVQRKFKLDNYDAYVDLLTPLFRQGQYVAPERTLHEIRQSAIDETEAFIATHGDAAYPVGLEKSLYELKKQLLAALK